MCTIFHVNTAFVVRYVIDSAKRDSCKIEIYYMLKSINSQISL
jgi:hypothetical protein